MAGGVAQIPFYVTLFRGDRFASSIKEIAPVALRYGASRYSVHRNRVDTYKFLMMNTWEDKQAFEAYWYGPEFNHWRAVHSSWYQVPLLYTWADLIIEGGTGEEQVESIEAGEGYLL
jgi:quinol monooxygenase YgiN